jgi:hypothetical protein
MMLRIGLTFYWQGALQLACRKLGMAGPRRDRQRQLRPHRLRGLSATRSNAKKRARLWEKQATV